MPVATQQPIELDDDEIYEAGVRLRNVLEGDAPMVAPQTAEEQLAMWQWIASEIGRGAAEADFVASACEDMDFPHWTEILETHERARATGNGREAVDALLSGNVQIVVYHRALGRFPGGNCDSHLVKHVVDPVKETVTVSTYCNWDGSASVTLTPGVFRQEEAKKMSAEVVSPLLTLLQFHPTQQQFNALCLPRGDSDSYVCEWTSVEVLVCDPDSGACHARIHLGPEGARNPAIEHAARRVTAALGLTVESFNDEDDSDYDYDSAFDNLRLPTDIATKEAFGYSFGYCFPLYLPGAPDSQRGDAPLVKPAARIAGLEHGDEGKLEGELEGELGARKAESLPREPLAASSEGDEEEEDSGAWDRLWTEGPHDDFDDNFKSHSLEKIVRCRIAAGRMDVGTLKHEVRKAHYFNKFRGVSPCMPNASGWSRIESQLAPGYDKAVKYLSKYSSDADLVDREEAREIFTSFGIDGFLAVGY